MIVIYQDSWICCEGCGISNIFNWMEFPWENSKQIIVDHDDSSPNKFL